MYRNTTSTTTGATQLNASPITTTTYSDTAVTATTTYYYWVIAVNTAGASTYSTSDYGVCALVSPTGVSATKNTYLNKVQITWAASTGATAYDVYRNTTNTSGTANKLNSSDITTTSYNDTTAVAGTTYYFWVVARNAEGTSAFSNSDTGERSAAIQEVKPNNTYTLAQNVGTVTGVTLIDGNLASSSDVGWYEFTLPVAGNSSSSVVVGFTGASGQVQAAIYSNPAKSGPVATSTNAANSATMSLNGFAAGAYYIRVYGSAAYTYTITITPPAPPTAPTGLTASQNTYDNHVALSWTASTGATGYNVYRNTSNTTTGATKLNASVLTTTTYSDTTVTATTTYYYWVTAANGVGASAYSTDASGSCSLVAAPTGVSATSGTSYSQVQVTWTASTGATGYNVYRNGSNTTTGATELNASSITTTTYNDSTAVAGETYYYWVVATNSAGTSAYGSSVTGYVAAISADRTDSQQRNVRQRRPPEPGPPPPAQPRTTSIATPAIPPPAPRRSMPAT